MKRIWAAIVIVSCIGAWLLTRILDLPMWTPFAFALSFPIYYLVLRYLAAQGLASWERTIRSRLMSGASPTSTEAWLPRGPILSWYFPRFMLLERAAVAFRDNARWPEASSHFEAALRLAPELDRPRLAREVWAALKKQRAEMKPNWGAYLEEALKAPDPPYDLFEDWADVLVERGKFAEADLEYRRALERATTDGQRFKIYCRLAIACVRDGRYGAADGALHEANEMMPTGDPGFQALYDRTADDVSAAKDAARSGQIHLVQIARKKD
jgi:tetratricopeptide (TPR) repeat protein